MSQATALLPQPALNGAELYEVIDGKRVEISPMGAYAGTAASVLVFYLNQFAFPRDLGWAVSEVMFDLGPGRNKRRPDVAFISAQRWQQIPDRGQDDPPAWKVVPNLGVEVISPSNTWEAMEGKILEYFEAGMQLVWVIFPRLQRVYVYESSTTPRVLTRKDVLDGGPVLPGFQLALAEFFDRLPPL
jgi:Uma2 family endonuclease